MQSQDVQLLCNKGESVPDSVQALAKFFQTRTTWCSFARNKVVTSCRDAAKNRYRLGHTGIELHDELKSWAGKLQDETVVMVHTRGDQQIDWDGVVSVLGERPTRLDSSETTSLGVDYGVVCPFLYATEQVLHIFDTSLTTQIGAIGTLMTNAGEPTWSVEMRPADLKRLFPTSRFADISADPIRLRTRTDAPIGILTGNSASSGRMLWERIETYVQRRLGKRYCGDTSNPTILIRSVPAFGESMELESREDVVRANVLEATRKLCESGAKLVLLACNTIPYFSEEMQEVCNEYGARFLSMPEVVESYLRSQAIEEVALVAIGSVADLSGEYSSYSEALEDIEVEPLTPAALQAITDIGYLVKGSSDNHVAFQQMVNLLRDNITSENIVVALTEFSVLLPMLKTKHTNKRIIDTMDLYAQAVAQWFAQAP